MVNGILVVRKNGCFRRALPADFPPWQAGYYFAKWALNGTSERANACSEADWRARKKPGPNAAIVDTQIMKNTLKRA